MLRNNESLLLRGMLKLELYASTNSCFSRLYRAAASSNRRLGTLTRLPRQQHILANYWLPLTRMDACLLARYIRHTRLIQVPTCRVSGLGDSLRTATVTATASTTVREFFYQLVQCSSLRHCTDLSRRNSPVSILNRKGFRIRDWIRSM